MLIKQLNIQGFGNLNNETLKFSEGINILYGPNESGKTTVHTYISSMLFGMERVRGKGARNDTWSKYLPWENPGVYGGSIQFELEEVSYLLERHFLPASRSYSLINENNGKHYPDSQDIRILIPGLTKTAYENTISIGQLKSAAGQDLAIQVQNHMINLATAGDRHINTAKAVLALKNEKKEWEKKLKTYAGQQYYEVCHTIDTLEGKMEHTDTRQAKSKVADIALIQQQINALAEDSHRISQDLSQETYRQKFPDNGKPAGKGFKSAGLALMAMGALCLLTAALRQTQLFPTLALGGLTGFLGLLCYFTGKRRGTSNTAKPHHLVKEMSDIEAFKSLNRLSEKKSAIDSQIIRLQSDLSVLQERQNAIARTIWEQEQQEEHLNHLLMNKENLESDLIHNEKIHEEMEAIDKAISIIEKLSSSIHESQGQTLNSLFTEYAYQITGGKYQKLYVDEDLNVSLHTGSKVVRVTALSQGTMDQIHLALRMAAVKYLFPDQVMPLLFDDSFALYDDIRLAHTLQWLADTYPGQIIIFTCQKRESEILNKSGIPFGLITLH